MTRVKDLQFLRYFIRNELQVNPKLANQLLDVHVNVRNMGEPDTAYFKNNELVISQPSSITKFLFVTLYELLKGHVNPGPQLDKFGLGLIYACRDYVFNDADTYDTSKAPPIMITAEKIPVLTVLTEDIIEPLVGKLKKVPLLYLDSNSTDSCRIVSDSERFSKLFDMPYQSIARGKFPFIAVNRQIHNRAAQLAQILYQTIVVSHDEDAAAKIVRNILLDDEAVLGGIMSVVKVLEGDPGFLMDFLKFFESNVTLTEEEELRVASIQSKKIESDNFLKDRIKIAQSHTPQVFKQWHQWSMIMGLIEKQLAPMRGSMWPTTELVKPFEDVHRRMVTERAKQKGKKQLGMEELLEVARELYGHKAFQPGKLYEELLRENRVWKT